MWPFGFEAWCNLSGKYFYIEADLSNYTGEEEVDMSLCQLGLFGSQYGRDEELLPVYEIDQGDRMTFQVQDIYSKIQIGTKIEIGVRQASDLYFVNII